MDNLKTGLTHLVQERDRLSIFTEAVQSKISVFTGPRSDKGVRRSADNEE